MLVAARYLKPQNSQYKPGCDTRNIRLGLHPTGRIECCESNVVSCPKSSTGVGYHANVVQLASNFCVRYGLCPGPASSASHRPQPSTFSTLCSGRSCRSRPRYPPANFSAQQPRAAAGHFPAQVVPSSFDFSGGIPRSALREITYWIACFRGALRGI